MKTCNVYNKHLTLDKRIEIEKGIEEKKNFTQIGLKISKSPKTVSNEILRNRQIEHCLSWVGKYKSCDKKIELRSDSRKGIDMTSTEFNNLNNIVSKEIEQGHSFSMILRNHKNEFNVSERTLYNYVENGYLNIIDLDLPRKVRYKKRKTNSTKITKDTKIRINRTYKDFKEYVKNYNDNNFNINIVEMDTVEGTKGVDLCQVFRHEILSK